MQDAAGTDVLLRVVGSKRGTAAVHCMDLSCLSMACVCKHIVHVGSHVSFRQMCVDFLIIDCDLCFMVSSFLKASDISSS